MQNQLRPGQLVTDEAMAGRRDAAHMPYVVVSCDSVLAPGDCLRLLKGNKVCWEPPRSKKQAVADPMLTEDIQPGRLFMAFLMPGLVSNLTHHFEIAGVPEDQRPETAEEVHEREALAGIQACMSQGCMSGHAE